MKHTKGPWKASPYHKGDVYAGLPGHDGKSIACTVRFDSGMVTEDESEANAERIVACVNGCDEAGIIRPDRLADFLAELATSSDLPPQHVYLIIQDGLARLTGKDCQCAVADGLEWRHEEDCPAS